MRALCPGLITFEKHSARRHSVRVKAFDLNNEEFLGSFDKLLPLGVTLRLQRGAELELSVVDETQRRWPSTSLAHSLHKPDSNLVVVEQ